ncbi:MAG TPA: STAS domain-containing protein [Candidatus Baltobacteraceae bacterium]|nr:STAS domain-containing protein [Candidatus Baltobacteraceae bacterium]
MRRPRLTPPQPYYVGRVAVLPVVGEVDLSTAREFEARIRETTDGRPAVVVDFSRTEYIDSTVLAILIRRKKALGDRFRVVVPKTARMRRVFDVTGLTGALGVKESVGDALAF